MFPKNKQDKLRNEEEWDKRRKLFKANATYFFCCAGSWENYFGVVCQQNNSFQGFIFLDFRVSTSKNKNADHRVKETCAIRSIQVTYETTSIYSVVQQCQMH